MFSPREVRMMKWTHLTRAVLLFAVFFAAGAVFAEAPQPFDPLMKVTEGEFPTGPVYVVFEPIQVRIPRGVIPPGVEFQRPGGRTTQSASAQSGPSAAAAGGKGGAATLDAGIGMLLETTAGAGTPRRVKPEDVIRELSRLRDEIQR